MKINHDRWSKLGEKNLGKHNIHWAMKMESMGEPGHGVLTLMKAIMNDCWADVGVPSYGWTSDEVNRNMSKLYWCWVAWLDATHKEEE